ncbi:sensor histidine kinase [Nonomuraea jiangxiensis]|uniref:Two-component system, NarL family, sensor histidine kinase DesK n=1 Tax=Nonomuraea jiangxiensis TaxID=633440 RepID=A0A1G8BZ48_9ACTN|nr:histidine kinase [Nonomuraea jiangxiensis]SDH38501.1 two-component system, NarL family, sensor histidine kinase DesK [Nonomuraea jiangxiensis]
MAARPDTAKKIIVYWLDGMVALNAALYLWIAVAQAMDGRITLPHAAIAIACVLGFHGLFPFLLRAAYDHRPRPTPKLLLGGVLATGVLLLLPPSPDPTSVRLEALILWVSVAALYLRPRAAALLTVAVAVLITAGSTAGLEWPAALIANLIGAAFLAVGMVQLRWLWWMIRDAQHSREAKARLAVAEERLRFARDLHDLLGHSLSVITLKSELAAKLATKDAGRAAAEMAEVRGLARDSLAEVQQAVHGYQALDLDEELEGVRAALEAAGARCEIELRPDDLSPAARTLLAWAVREGGTNVLKHSKATRCAITIAGGVLEMRNDGVHEAVAAPGNGLRGLSERLVTAGGSFSAAPTPTGEFLLRAAVPA